MKIAVAANGSTLEDLVPDAFEESPYLLIVETDDGSFEVYRNPEGQGGAGLAMTREIMKRDCEALISGSIEKPAFQELMIAQVTRYLAANCSAAEALRLMDANQLDFIRVPKGEVWDPHGHDHDSSRCEGHED
jgi:predicted Fe-Mo cluster-binding NifX family protein